MHLTEDKNEMLLLPTEKMNGAEAEVIPKDLQNLLDSYDEEVEELASNLEKLCSLIVELYA